ncbi:MAG TPA: ABC transporter ATP-binding protein [Magnetospirillaceae bacterium]|nr:ABC transporter ATP-binding protein [Magnetospirillaceae bacterium]
MSRLAWNGVSLARQGNPVLDGVSLSVAKGEMIGLIGPNGAGKTALLRLAVGFEKPDAGEVRLDDGLLSALPAAERARRLAYLPQQPETAWPITVAQAVALGRLPHGDRDEGAVARALEAVGMREFKDRPLTRLSGGERALVLLARALAVEAGLLLLDEPTANLDPAHQLRVMEVLRKRADHGDAVVVVMHDLSLATRSCDRLAVLHQGRLAADGTPDTILDDPLLREVFSITVERGQVDGRPFLVPSRWVA